VKRWVAPISKGGWHRLRSETTQATQVNQTSSQSDMVESEMVGGTDCGVNLQPESEKVGGTDLTQASSQGKKVGGTDLKWWVAPIAQTLKPPAGAKRWVAPISKGGWHRLRKPLKPPAGAKRWVAPISKRAKRWVAPISNGGWHRLRLRFTDCDCAPMRKMRILKMLSMNPKGDSSGVAMVTWVTPRRERSRQRGAKRATTTESDNQQATESKSPTSGGWHSVPISVVTATATHLSTASAVDSSLNRKRRELRESTEIHFQLLLK
jgi:hypothetical protein